MAQPWESDPIVQDHEPWARDPVVGDSSPKSSAPALGSTESNRRQAVRKAAADKESGSIKGMAKTAYGAAEAAVSAVGGVPAYLAGLASGANNVVKQGLYKAAGLDSSQLESPSQAFERTSGDVAGVFAPKTEAGQDIAAGDNMRQVNNTLTALGPKGHFAINPAVAMSGEAAQAARAGSLGRVADVARKAPGAARDVAAEVAPGVVNSTAEVAAQATKRANLDAPENRGIASAIDAGYKVTPKEGKAGLGARVTETAAGSARLSQELAAHNAENTARLARQDIGLPDDVPLTPEATKQIRDQEGQAYQAVSDVGRIRFDEAYRKDLDKIAAPYIEGGKDFDVLAKNPIIDAVDGLRKQEANTSSIITVVKDLRNKADKEFRTGDKKLGTDYRAAAQALDNAMDRDLGRMVKNGSNPELATAVDKYRAARQRIAKSYLLDDAMDGKPGEVNAKVYARALDRGAPLSGPGKQIADFAKQFGDAGLARKKGRSGAVGATAFDLGLAALRGPSSIAESLLTVGARPGARAYLGSDRMQRGMADRARNALPAEETAAAPPEFNPGTTQGFENIPQGRADVPQGPLGDLTPDFGTSPGVGVARPNDNVPGLVPALGDAPPMRVQSGGYDPRPGSPVSEVGPVQPGVSAEAPGAQRGVAADIPAVEGRPDLPDTMLTGRPAEVPGTEGMNAAMLDSGTQEAMRRQAEAAQPSASPVAPETDPRLADIQRLKASATSPAARQALHEVEADLTKKIASERQNQLRMQAAAELRQSAQGTTNPEVAAMLNERAEKIERPAISEFTKIAKKYKIPDDATKAALEKARSLPPEQVGGFLSKFVEGLRKREVIEADLEAKDLAPLTAEPKPIAEEAPKAKAEKANAVKSGDLLTGDGHPYGTRASAEARATREGGGEVVEVDGGFIVRQKQDRNATSESDKSGKETVRRSMVAKRRMAFNPETDGVLEALAKMGGLRRDRAASNLGVSPEDLSHTVRVGNLKGFPFRKAGMDIDIAAERLQEAGYFQGVPPDELVRSLEDAVHGELGGSPTHTIVGQMRNAEKAGREEATHQMSEAAKSRHDTLSKEASLTNEEISSLSIDDIDSANNASIEDFMRSVGFTEKEIADELARKPKP